MDWRGTKSSNTESGNGNGNSATYLIGVTGQQWVYIFTGALR